MPFFPFPHPQPHHSGLARLRQPLRGGDPRPWKPGRGAQARGDSTAPRGPLGPLVEGPPASTCSVQRPLVGIVVAAVGPWVCPAATPCCFRRRGDGGRGPGYRSQAGHPTSVPESSAQRVRMFANGRCWFIVEAPGNADHVHDSSSLRAEYRGRFPCPNKADRRHSRRKAPAALLTGQTRLPCQLCIFGAAAACPWAPRGAGHRPLPHRRPCPGRS